jgi:hypothetical protein
MNDLAGVGYASPAAPSYVEHSRLGMTSGGRSIVLDGVLKPASDATRDNRYRDRGEDETHDT